MVRYVCGALPLGNSLLLYYTALHLLRQGFCTLVLFIFLCKSDCLGCVVLLCFVLFVWPCLLLSSFLLHLSLTCTWDLTLWLYTNSHSDLQTIKVRYTHTCTCTNKTIYIYMYISIHMCMYNIRSI